MFWKVFVFHYLIERNMNLFWVPYIKKIMASQIFCEFSSIRVKYTNQESKLTILKAMFQIFRTFLWMLRITVLFLN